MSVARDGHFLYFAFGSNLLKERIQLTNHSSLQDFKLKFGFWGENVQSWWHGGLATIEFCPAADVWGVIWSMSIKDLTNLDNQEDVNTGMYTPLEVFVETDEGTVLCRTYQMNNFRAAPPSPQYKQVVCLGAEQNKLPDEYVTRLKAVQTNNYSGPSLCDQIVLPSNGS